MEKCVLVTGGTGSVGMNVCQELLARGAHVVLVARNPLKAAQENELRENSGELTVVLGNVLDEAFIEKTLRTYRVTDVIHGAAVTPGAESDLTQACGTIEINCIGTISMLNAALAYRLPGRFLLLGSISAYGRTALTQEKLVEGQSVADPRLIYEISKFAAERIFLRYREAAGLDGCAVRIGDVYGPWEHYSGVRPHMSLPYQTTALAAAGKKACFARDYSGEWIYGPELAEGICGLLEAPKLHYDVYPLSSGFRWRISEWCEKLREAFPAFTYDPAADADRVNIRINQPTDNGAMQLERMRADTGFAPRFGLDASFAGYMTWLKRHPNYLNLK
ncbi:MAG: NAD-dependent epimerase/dehydratase family protein [Anaerotruncus rubiinfantis]|jgi:nucleoside-diphosphate-sugar epimerase